MRVFKHFSQLLFLFGLSMLFVVSGWGANSCGTTVNGTTALTSSNTTYPHTNNALASNSSEKFYFTVSGPGTVTVSFSNVDGSNKTGFSGTQNPTTCPSSSTNQTTQTYTYAASGDLNIAVFNTSNSQSHDYTINVTFTPAATTSDLGITYSTAPSSATTSQTLNYVLAITQSGLTANTVTVTDSFPAGFSNLSASGTGWTCPAVVASATAISCTRASLSASSSITVTATAPATAGTYTPITATISALSPSDPVSSNNSAIATTTVSVPNADLSITKTVNNTVPAVGDTVVYTLVGTNNGPLASQFKITDVLRSGLTYVSATATNLNCTQAGGTVTCSGTNSFTSGQSATVTITATVTGAVGTPINNTAQITSNNSVFDANTANNSSSVAITPTAATTYTQPSRSFALRNAMNARGDVKLIGNSILCKDNGSGVCTDPGTQTNNGFNAIYSDIDGDPTTFRSSSADLALPSGSQVLWAGLYWQGVFPTDYTTDKVAARTVKLKIPGGSYATVAASQLDYNSNNGAAAYQGFADVTALLNLTNPNGTYYAANVTSALGTNAFGAWALSIIYQDNNDTLKNLTTYDGFQTMFGNSVSASVSGFRTPLSGTVASTFFIFAGEGDLGATGENIQITNKAGTQKSIYNTLNPLNDQFNSTTTYKNVANLARNPNYVNTTGVDIDTYDITNFLDLNQTSTTITLTAGNSDRYYVGAFGFSTQIYSPTIGNFNKNATVSYASNSSCSIGQDLRGATIHYSMTFQNTGTEAASNVKVYDDFQSNNILNYLDMNQTTKPTVQLLSGTGASTITCDKNSTAVYCNFDRIAINTKYQINFDVKIQSSLSTSSDITLGNSASAHYYNASTGDEITQLATSNTQIAGGLCAVLPVADYRFDECSWNGTIGEVIDSSGNNYNGSINQSLTTSSGGQICQTTIFNGTSQYISIPQIPMNKLLSTASLSFWIKTTQTGNDTDWLAPGVTGVEQAGTNNDIFWGWIDGSGKIGLNALGDGIQAKSSVSINDGIWRHIALTRDASTGLLQIYINGVLNASGTGGTGTIGTTFSSIGRIEDTGGTPTYFNGSLDEVKVFDRALSASEIANIYDNEAAYKNFNGTIRICNNCVTPPIVTNSFDAWDSFRSISDRNISTKIVNKPFVLTIASMNGTKTAYQDFNGTVCTQIVDSTGNALSTWNKLLFTSAQPQSATSTLSLNRAIGGNDSAGIKLYWKKSVDNTCPLIGEDNSTLASDRFAIRPASFAISAPNAVAGTDFNITFGATNFTSTAYTDYNETAGGSFDVTYSEHNISCPIGTFNPVPSGGWSFVNGSKNFTTRYSEVGIVDVNISDTAKPCTSRYTQVDCDDANVSDGSNYTANLLPIGLVAGQITIKPHHFDVNATLTNFAAGTFTYLSTDLNMSAPLNVTVNAKNGENNVTKNYDKGCYAKSTTLTLPHSVVPSPLSKIFYTEALSGTSSNVLKGNDITLSLGNTIFTQGSAPLALKLNFDRDRSAPLNPFDFNITSTTIAETNDNTVNNSGGINTTLGTAKFLYGRIRPYNLTTNISPAPNPVEFEVYSSTSSGYVSTMPQNVLNWYRNTNHSTAAAGNIIKAGFSAGATDSNISVLSAPQNGVQTVTVTSLSDQTVHLDISQWLWYSAKYDYSYNSSCAYHPCFSYKYTDSTSAVNGVSSGIFNGSDFQMTPAQNITNKGVKLFR